MEKNSVSNDLINLSRNKAPSGFGIQRQRILRDLRTREGETRGWYCASNKQFQLAKARLEILTKAIIELIILHYKWMEALIALIDEHGSEEQSSDAVLVALTEVVEARSKIADAGLDDTWEREFRRVIDKLCSPSHAALLGHVGWELISSLDRYHIPKWRDLARPICERSPSPRELVLALTRVLGRQESLEDQAATLPLLMVVFARLPDSSFLSSSACQAVCSLNGALQDAENPTAPELAAWLARTTQFITMLSLTALPTSASIVRDGQLACVAILGHVCLVDTTFTADAEMRATCAATKAAVFSFFSRMRGSAVSILARAFGPSDEPGEEASSVRVTPAAMGRFLAHVILSAEYQWMWPSVFE